MTERPNPVDAIRTNLREIDADLGKINLTVRLTKSKISTALNPKLAEREINSILPTLYVVTDAHFIIGSLDGEYVIGDITLVHWELFQKWNEERRRKGLHNIPMNEVGIASGIGFNLKDIPSTKYVRFDIMTKDWKGSPPKYVKSLANTGYIVLDGEYNQIK